MGDLQDKLLGIEGAVRAAIGRLRKMVFELKPPSLEDEGLAPALTLYLEEMKQDSGIGYRVENELRDELPVAVRLTLYRIAQEALVNVRKHAGASHVVVRLSQDEDVVRMHIRDDGIGFDPHAAAAQPGHIGLSEIHQRAEMSGGEASVISAPGAGTELVTWVPLGVPTRSDGGRP